MNKLFRNRQNSGITLIALVITIIILLILAGISISSLTDNGLFGKAKDAEKKHNQAVANEQSTLQDYLDVLKINDPKDSVLDGQGTEAEPYVIKSIEDLVLFAYEVNQGKNYQGKYVKLERDLDFNLDESYEKPNRTDYTTYGYDGELKTLLTTGEGFRPIGITSDNQEKPFAGIFDGNGKTISNLRINKESNIGAEIGLFASNYGTIKNLGIKDCNIDFNAITVSEGSYGTICGTNYEKINNCWASGSINIQDVCETSRIGGIVGMSLSDGNISVIENCYSEVNINVNKTNIKEVDHISIGGILGGSTNTDVISSYNAGNLKANCNNIRMPLNVGGVVGYSVRQVRQCYNIGDISGYSDIGAKTVVGGIVGNVSELVSECYNLGSIESTSVSNEAASGGIVGGRCIRC